METESRHFVHTGFQGFVHSYWVYTNVSWVTAESGEDLGKLDLVLGKLLLILSVLAFQCLEGVAISTPAMVQEAMYRFRTCKAIIGSGTRTRFHRWPGR